MKQLVKFIAAAMLLAACHSKNGEEADGSNAIPAKEKELKDAVAQYPDSLLLKENLIQYYRENGRYDMAIAATNSAIAGDSANPRLWDMKAILLFENEDTLGSINAYERAIAIYPNPEYMIALGSQYAQTKNPKALQIADTLLAHTNARADKEALFIKGLYHTYTNDKQKAISFFDKCLDLDYTFTIAYLEKGIALYDMGKYEEALNVLNRAITVRNNYDEGYYWMGRCLEKLQRIPEAIESYRTALRYDPAYTEAKEALAGLGIK